MKFSTVCVTHILMNGETKHQVYLAKNYKKCNFLMELLLLAGCPTCIAESLSCGTPPITTYQRTTHLVKDGINGIILPKKNINHCIRTLNSCITIENYNKLKSNIDYKELTWSKMCDKFLYNIELK